MTEKLPAAEENGCRSGFSWWVKQRKTLGLEGVFDGNNGGLCLDSGGQRRELRMVVMDQKQRGEDG